MQAVLQQPELCGMSARARPRVTLRMVLVLFAELFFALDLNYFLRPPLLKAQLAHPPTTSSAFPNAGESKVSQLFCMMERRLQRKSRGNGVARGIGG